MKKAKAVTEPPIYAKTVQPESFEAWVREFTGGPNGCQIPHGGTCVRPDILLHNDKCCDTCECVQHCLCKSKKLRKK